MDRSVNRFDREKMAVPPFETHVTRGSLIVTLMRPAARNPLSGEVLSALAVIFEGIRDPTSHEEIILTGSGGAFASGADLKEIAALTEEESRNFAQRGQRLMDMIANSPIPTKAFINGHCYGGGLDLALACHRRVATPGAAFCHPGARLGIMTGWGGTQRLPRLIGEARALEVFFTAEPIDSAEALRIGLIDGIFEDLGSMLSAQGIQIPKGPLGPKN